MNLCSRGHDEICFDGSRCPLCIVQGDKDDELRKLTEELDDTKTERDSFRARIRELTNE